MANSVNVFSEARVAGVYSFQVYGPDGELRRKAVAPESPNLITNAGLDALGGKYGLEYQRYCCVGGGNTPPAVTDTAIESLIASADYGSAKQAGEMGTESSSPYYTWIKRTWRFGEGVATGNISEVTVGWNSAGNGIFSRALILDEFGNPTTLTVLSDETLDVTYEFRYYPKLTDDTGTGLVFGGNIGGTYDWTFRSAQVGVFASYDGADDGWGLNANYTSLVHNPTMHNAYNIAGHQDVRAYDGPIGTVTGLPSGASASYAHDVVESFSALPYIDGSFEREFSVTLGLNQANLTNGVRSLAFTRCGIGSYQIQFDPAIPKTATDKLTINFKLSWGRL